MAILSAKEISSIVSDIRTIIADDVISTSIIYKQSGSTVDSWSPTSQLIPAMWTESSVSAFKGSYSLDEISESTNRGTNKNNTLIEYGDTKFIFLVSDIQGILTTDDMICESGSTFQSTTTYQIVSINRDPLAIAYFLQSRAI